MSNQIDSQDKRQNNSAVVDFPEIKTIEQQASEWLAKLDAETPSAEVLAGFKEWVNNAEENRLAFEEMVAFWDDMNILTQAVLPREQLQAKAIQKAAQEPIQELIQEPNQTALTRLLSPLQALFTHITVSARAISTISTKAAFATIMLTIGLLITTSLWSPAPKLYTTDIGEQKTIELADHSIVQLNTNSRLEVDYSADYRRLRLVQGEAHFDVAHNPDRPFEVYAGQGLVRAVGTSFTVHMRKIDVEVIVTEGAVEFDRTDSTAPAQQPKTQINVTAIQGPLDTETGKSEISGSATGNSETSASTNPATTTLKVEAGNMLTYSANDLDDIKQLVASQIEQQLAWRQGMLMFQGEPLQNVVDEISRYTDLKIIIPERSAREMKVGGLFKVGDTESLFEALRDGFDIHVKKVSRNVVYLISNENR